MITGGRGLGARWCKYGTHRAARARRIEDTVNIGGFRCFVAFECFGVGEVVRVFGEEIVCANIVFADGLTHVVAAFFPPFSVSKQGLMGDFKWCSWFCFQFVCLE